MINDIKKVVVDTNVLISGLFGIKNSPPASVLNDIRSQRIILVMSPFILEEVVEVINREKVIKRTKMSSKERTDFIDKLIERSDITTGIQLSQMISRDIKDDKFLACAVEARADYVVTGDKDLLAPGKYEGIKIVTPREFLKILK